MNTVTQHLLTRSLGLGPASNVKRTAATRLVYALQPAPVTFRRQPPCGEGGEHARAHASGVNALTIDRFEGRYLLSGGADSSVAIWDLESSCADGHGTAHLPLSAAANTAQEHRLGITQTIFYPFDSLAFLTSSYDHTVKMFSSETLHASASFDLDSVVYNISMSPIADHVLVACATQHPAVRLIDLRSGASTHSLAGHAGAVLCTAWSPVREHVLASGATDGSVRFWDIRRGAAELGTLDMEDSVGVVGAGSRGSNRTGREGRAHRGPVNGIVWTEDGHHVVTCGHDERIRVWDTDTGANTLANFGPTIRNAGLAPVMPVLAPTELLPLEKDVLFYPNGSEVLGFELFEGKLMHKLRRAEPHPLPHHDRQGQAAGSGSKVQRDLSDRITALAWRAHDVELYSAHADGSIVAWKPRTIEDADLDEEEEREREDVDESGHSRKRRVLEDIYQDLTKRRVTFGGK